MIPCSRCGRASVTHIRYSGQHLCERHFKEFFERRFARDMRKSVKLRRGATVAVAISGGKDSVTLLRLARKVFHERTGIGIAAIIVDEGIRGYRAEGVRVARRECRRLGVPLKVVKFRELFGRTLDEAALLDPGTIPCTYCGVWRRAALNRAALELGAAKLLLGHNLDDTAESLLMNYVRGDVERMARMGPHDKVQPGLVPRMMPMRSLPEEEVKLYSILEGMRVLERECPYAERAQRGQFVRMLAQLEDASPGTRHAILRGHDSMREALRASFRPADLTECSRCREPGMAATCKACEMVARLEGKARRRKKIDG
ncbi:MAG: TIGR00269 family protein [Methanobacteriota archaeon]